jgi:hypothetical protein
MAGAPDPCQHLSPSFVGPKWYSATAGAAASRAANDVIAAKEIVKLRIVVLPKFPNTLWVELFSHKQCILKKI